MGFRVLGVLDFEGLTGLVRVSGLSRVTSDTKASDACQGRVWGLKCIGKPCKGLLKSLTP